ncbi:DUF2147 domain-containing protein [Pseudooceanicola sp. CBS1P-1]|uniref:DUF2147 domain-containing protein n=1 Tax=Pseudooceanicola albus TaxID=2692189 RepID=A0A6L7G0A4_9RHOB|nr:MULTISPECIES: DUF2147 domain-containing protein [Pseudooceanicola]MBT9382366.1 DUF2147 domain-containing protein [Pseudooceanicola endophyticus]MXN16908.1 DUF2147 domain-containing protein [Pseudooceanicola albus]
MFRRAGQAALMLGAMLLAAPVAAQAPYEDPLVGMWLSPPAPNGMRGRVMIQPCGPAYCGTVAALLDPQGRVVPSDAVGTRIAWGMQPTAPAYYSGMVWVPGIDQTVSAEMLLQGDVLQVQGCVNPMLCDLQVWRRLR